MKKLFLPLLALYLASCSSETEEIVSTKSGLDINTSIVQEAITRASLNPTVARLNAIILDGDGAIVKQKETDATSDQIGIDLDPGDYTLLLVGNAGSAPVVNTDGTCTYTKVGDAFSYTNSFSINRDKRTALSATMTRCVAKFTFKSTDVIPSTASKMTFKMENISDTYNIETHNGTNADASYQNTVSVASFKQTDGTLSCYIYTLLPAESITNGKFTLSFLDADGNEISAQTWSDLPLTQNRNTVLTSAMFHTHGADATVSINTEWGEDITVDR